VNPAEEITDDHVAYWAGHVVKAVTFQGDGDSVGDVRALITTDHDGTQAVRVPWKLNEIELAQLARGGTIWLSVWGGLPPHMLEVQP
jgi:hypothetical protein